MTPSPFFKSLSWLLLLNLLVKPVWIFFIDRPLQNIVGLTEYGTYFSLLNLSLIFFFIADAGLSNMLNQRMAGRQSVNIYQLLKLKVFLLAIYALACCFVGWATGITSWNVLIYLIVVQALLSLFVFLRNIITAFQFFSADAWFSIIDKLLMILVCGGFIYGIWGSIDVILFLQIQIICTAVSVSVAAFFIINKIKIVPSQKEKWSTVVKWVLPFAAIILLMSLHYRLDGFLLERLYKNGAQEAGIYASAYRLLDAGHMVGYLAASFLVPFIAANTAQYLFLKKTISITRNGLLALGISIVLFVVLLATPLQQLLYHTQSTYISTIMQFCIGALPAYYLVHVYGSVLTALRQFRVFLITLGASVLINAILNLLLIPQYGALGCCVAALVSQYFCGITLYILVHKNLKSWTLFH